MTDTKRGVKDLDHFRDMLELIEKGRDVGLGQPAERAVREQVVGRRGGSDRGGC